MKLIRLVKAGIQALGSHKLRTFFMMVGTLIGIAALTVIMAMGAGTERAVMKRVSVFGFRAIMVMAGGGKTFPPSGADSVVTLRLEDVDVIRSQVAGIEAMAPAVQARGATFKAGAAQSQAPVFGVEPDWHVAWEWDVQRGDPINGEDVASLARVCVLGQSLRQALFGDADPVGQFVQVNNVRFQVKGVLEPKGTSPMGSDMDNRALIPLTTGMRRLLNQEHLSQIRLKLKDDSQLEEAGERIRAILRERHRITPPEEDDFQVRTAADVAKVVRGISGTLSTLLTVLAGLSLLVGGIVLMNIQLISVSERTKEIGLRRAVGATQRDIFHQFLAEALSVTLLGMLLGSGLGWGIAATLAAFTPMAVALSWEPFALGLTEGVSIQRKIPCDQVGAAAREQIGAKLPGVR
ncbi:MAG: ABC transporter permease [Verrucomicrobia bacterium]|nr:ABC transporter permease [Verrucomicrobiota bacterium]